MLSTQSINPDSGFDLNQGINIFSRYPIGINLDNLWPKSVDQSAKNIPRYDLAFPPGKVDEETGSSSF